MGGVGGVARGCGYRSTWLCKSAPSFPSTSSSSSSSSSPSSPSSSSSFRRRNARFFFSLADLEPNTESVDQTNAGAECRVGGIALDVDLEYSSKKRINRSSERERERETIRIPWRLVSSSFFDEIRRPFVSLSLSLSLTRSDRCAKKRCKNHDVDVGKKQPNRCVFNSFAILGRLTTTTLSTATWFVEGEPRAHLHGNRPGRSGQRSPFF